MAVTRCGAGRAQLMRCGWRAGCWRIWPGQCGALLRKARGADRDRCQCPRPVGRALAARAGAQRARKPRFLVHAPGEAAKSWDGLARTVDWLLAEEVERGDHIMALGGGVIGDLTGFAASVLKRGCGFVQIAHHLAGAGRFRASAARPRSIPAAGKNLVGAFHQPALVLADIDALATLPQREMRCGYAEVIKYGILGDAGILRLVRGKRRQGDGGRPMRRWNMPSIASVAAKARIVAEDERETTGARALLNLGHTFGHALEARDRLFRSAAAWRSSGAGHGAGGALFRPAGAIFRMADATRILHAIAACGLPMRNLRARP